MQDYEVKSMRCAVVQKEIIAGKMSDKVTAHLRACKICAGFQANYQLLFQLTGQVPEYQTPQDIKNTVLATSLTQLQRRNMRQAEKIFSLHQWWQSSRMALGLSVLFLAGMSIMTVIAPPLWHIVALLFLAQNIFLCLLTPIFLHNWKPVKMSR